jgi:integrase
MFAFNITIFVTYLLLLNFTTMSVTVREKKRNKGGVILYLDVYHNGARKYQSLNINISPADSKKSVKEKRRLAEIKKSEKEIELASEGSSYRPEHLKKVDFYNYLESYLDSYTKKDVRMIQRAIQLFMDFNNKNKLYVNELTPRLIEGFRDFLIDPINGLSGETPKNYFSRFKKVLRAAVRDNVLSLSPAENIQFKKSQIKMNPRKEILTSEEVKHLFNTHCDSEVVKTAFLFSCFTGLGLSEIKRLTWCHLKYNRIKIRRSKTGVLIDNKLSQKALEMIGKPGRQNDLVFDINFSDTWITKVLKNWMKKATIEKHVTFYCARHTFATNLLLNGANLKTVSDLMGQTSVKHTEKYLNYINPAKEDAIEQLFN